MRKYLLLTALSLGLLGVNAQTQQEFRITKTAKVNLSEITTDFEPVLNHLEAPSPGGNSYKDHLQALKSTIIKGESAAYKKGSGSEVHRPKLYRNFNGNPYNGIPNDNHLAISNGGMIVSVNNSRMLVYDENGKELMRKSLAVIADPLNVKGSYYDPRVHYDPDEDKFILCFLGGKTDSTSNIIFGFSQTNDPTKDWNLFVIPGNPFNDVSWSDYPMIATTKDELFFTINLLKNLQPGESWKDAFKQTIIWQIDKASGFDGADELVTTLHSGINWKGKPIRNVCPVKGGSGNHGPNMYFLSNRNFDLENDTIFFIEITDKRGPDAKLNISALNTNQKYGLAPDASQTFGALTLQTNDSRVLDAFLENDRILFSGNCVDFNNNWASIYIGVISDVSSNPSIKGQIVETDSLEFGYPGIAYTGDGSDENDAIIFVNHSSKNHFPGCGMFYWDGEALSNYKYVKEGETYINMLSQTNERWGDYIGCQRKYNEDGEAWVCGTWGYKRSSSENRYATWIAEITSPFSTSIEEKENNELSLQVYPNPANERFSLAFTTKETTYGSFKLINMQGQVVEHFFSEKIKAGRNEFSFRTLDLESGLYQLIITDEVSGQRLAVGSVVVE